MSDPDNPSPKPQAAPVIARVCAAVAVLLGALVLIGWALGIEVLKKPISSEVPMWPNAALSFVLLGASLLLVLTARKGSAPYRVGQALAAVAALGSLLALVESAFGSDLGIDRLLFWAAAKTVASRAPGRIVAYPVVCFLLFGSALLLLDRRDGPGLAQGLATAGAFVGLLGVVPYLYGELPSSAGYLDDQAEIAVHTAVGLVVLGVGVLLARPDRGPVSIFYSDTAGGNLARRALPVAVGLPLVVGWLVDQGHHEGLYANSYRAVAMTAASAAALTVLTWVGARSAHHLDLRRRRAEQTREDFFRLNPSPSFTTRMADGLFVDVNDELVRTFGWTRDELIGHKTAELKMWRDVRARDAFVEMLRDRGTVVGLEVALQDRWGLPLTMLTSARVADIDGEASIVGALLDMTERKRTEEEVRRSARRIEALNAIARDILAARSMEELARVGLSRLRELVPFMRASLTRFDPETQELVILALVAEGETDVGIGARFPLSAVGPPDLLLRGEINRVTDTLEVEDPAPGIRRLIDEGVRMYANVPMVAKGELIGTINISSTTPGGFTEEDLEAAREVAELLTVAMVQSDLRDELLRRATDLERRVAARAAALSESETRFRSVLANAPDAVLLVDRTGVITLANDAAATLFGYETVELLGMSVEALVPEPLRAAHVKNREGHLTHPAARPMGTGLALRGRRKDGTEFPADISLSSIPVHDSHEGPKVIAFIRDVTERERAEEVIVAAKEEAEQANRAKDEFLSRMSHELRTPLNAVLGFAQVLEMEDLPPEQHDSVRQIRKGGEHLLELIDEVLDISRMATGGLSLSLEPVGVSEAVRGAVDLAQPLAAERSITLRLEDPDGLHVLADRQRLTQILLNLLSNAIKYNREAGSVDVSWAKAPQGRLRIQVGDTGPGIRPDRLERVFVPFDRLGAEGSGVQGSGLGLSLSKALVEAMGGTLEVKSEVGTGSVFTVELSLAEPPAQRYEQERREDDRFEEGGEARTVLYVEDNLSNLQLVERIFERRPGVRLLTAMQGSVGIDLARQHQPDLILLDLHLPDIEGKEALRRLREDPATMGIPVVVISADATQAQIKALLAAGARDYLTKPIGVPRFLDVVDDLLRGPEDG